FSDFEIMELRWNYKIYIQKEYQYSLLDIIIRTNLFCDLKQLVYCFNNLPLEFTLTPFIFLKATL
ncbi:MAG: hypothetical protein QG611_678, partial [Bacteroidota bacterium]|nr:hypothetical protein [Bacteroidota bacterium]